MTASDNENDPDTALALFRRDAERLGFGSEDLGELAAELETAEEFIARMKRLDAETGSSRPRSSRRRLLAAGAVAGLAASAALVFGVVHPGGDAAAAESPPVLDYEFAAATQIAYAPGENPSQILGLLETAANGSDTAKSRGEIQYKKSDSWFAEVDDNGTSKIVPRVTETWLFPDGSLTTHEHLGRPLSSDGRGALPATGKQLLKETLEPGTFPAQFARTLPTDPDRLTTALVDHGQCESRQKNDDRSLCLYRQVVELSQLYVISPKLSAAIWSMLADQPGFRTLGSVKDRAGRDAVAISLISSTQPEIRHLLLGSLTDGSILGNEDILIRRDPNLDVDPPSVLSFSAVLSSVLTPTPPN